MVMGGGENADGKLHGGINVFAITENSWNWHPLHFLHIGVFGCCSVCETKCSGNKRSVEEIESLLLANL
jgi:hypothetical protein